MLSHSTSYRVIYGDTDMMGIAYYANYLRWFEIGRTELLRAWGLPYRELEAQGILLPVSEALCKYMAPARYDDVLTIEAGLSPELKAGLKIEYRITGADAQTVHATGHTIHAFLNREGRVIRPPQFFRALIREQSGEAGV
jgi:acyl-CoA thioester hydrolase